MASYGQSRETRAPADRFWRIWSDTSTWPSWNPDIQEVKLDRPLGSRAGGRIAQSFGPLLEGLAAQAERS